VIGVPPIVLILVAMGGMCPKCGHGTRKTSKRWAKCKACGERVRRHTEDEMREMLAPLRAADVHPTTDPASESREELP
jgi:uncharacterized protein (DUF983 family)